MPSTVRHFACILLAALTFALIPLGKANALGGLMLSPLRIVIDDGQRYAQLTIINQEKDIPLQYKLSVVPLRMNGKGELFAPKELTKREELAQSMIRFSPRSAVLQPAGKQIIRIMTRIPPNLPDGEYFTYLAAMPLEPQEQAIQQQVDGINTQIKMLVGIRIPIIIQHGTTHVQTEVLGARLGKDSAGKRQLEVMLQRSGNKSSQVGITAYSLANGQKTLIGRNIRAVTYIPLEKRVAPVYLSDESFRGGKVLIELTDYEARNAEVISSKEFVVQ